MATNPMVAGFEYGRERRDALQDQQRQAELANADSPAMLQAIAAEYRRNPSRVKNFVENLIGRLRGRSPQPMPNPYAQYQQPGGTVPQNRQQALAALAPRVQQDEMQALKAQLSAQANAQQEAGLAGAQRAIQTYKQLFPNATQEDLQRFSSAVLGAPLTKPTTDEMKRQDYEAMLLSGQVPKDSSGNPLTYEAWVAYNSASGRAAGTPQKLGTPRAGMSGGKNVYALLTPNGWVDAGTQQPLSDFRPMPTYAQLGLYEPVLTFNPETGQLVSGTFNRRTGQTDIKPITSGAPLAAPAAKELTQNLQPAIEADTRLQVMEASEASALAGDQQAMLNIVANHIGMTLGLQKGARINQAVWNEAIESTPWLAHLAASWSPDGYLSGVKLTKTQIHQMIALAEERRQAQWQQAQQAASMYGVNLTVPDFTRTVPGTAPAPKKPIVQKNKRTGAYRYSTDGGKTWQMGQPPANPQQ